MDSYASPHVLSLVDPSAYFKYTLLVTLVVQNAVLILSMRYSRLVEGELNVVYTCNCYV